MAKLKEIPKKAPKNEKVEEKRDPLLVREEEMERLWTEIPVSEANIAIFSNDQLMLSSKLTELRIHLRVKSYFKIFHDKPFCRELFFVHKKLLGPTANLVHRCANRLLILFLSFTNFNNKLINSLF